MTDHSMHSPDTHVQNSGDVTQLLAENFDGFKEELETLYILANRPGRINFMKNWPVVAEYIFGDELIKNDMEGAHDEDRQHELEKQAETKRIGLLDLLDPVEEKSVYAGALQLDYVQGLVEKIGRAIALNVYSRSIVDRFIPPTPEELEAEGFSEEQVDVVPDYSVKDNEFSSSADEFIPQESPHSPASDDAFEDQESEKMPEVRNPLPIDMEQPLAPQSQEDKPLPPDMISDPMAPEPVPVTAEDGLPSQPIEASPSPSLPQASAAESSEQAAPERALTPLEQAQKALMEEKPPQSAADSDTSEKGS